MALILLVEDEKLLRFERDDFTSLDPRRLDDAVREMWSEVPTHRKLAAGLTPLAAMLATVRRDLLLAWKRPGEFAKSGAIVPSRLSWP